MRRVALVASLVSSIRSAEANGTHAVIVDLARGLGAGGHEATIARWWPTAAAPLPEVVPHAVGGWLVDAGDEAGLVDAIQSARTLDRGAIRERARRELGVDRMVEAYERELLATAAQDTARAS